MAEQGSRKAVKQVRKGSKNAPKRTAADDGEAPLFNPTTHELVPKHEKLSEKEKAEVFERYHISLRELPKISSEDPVIRGLGVKQGDIIMITRKSHTAGEAIFYRGVIDE